MSAGLSDSDVQRLTDAFWRSGCVGLELEVGQTRLRLGAAGRTSGAVETVASPAVGIFHAAAAEGDAIEPGAELGRIRSVRSEAVVRAGQAGVIAALPVADGGFVEYGAHLADILVGAA